jgi:hypothetical protein
MAEAERELALLDVIGRFATALELPHQLVDFVVIRGQQDEGVVGIDVRLAGVPLGMRGFLARNSHHSLRWLPTVGLKRLWVRQGCSRPAWVIPIRARCGRSLSG